MDAMALPLELLDETELRFRYKDIDEAIKIARANIEKSVSAKTRKRIKVRFHIAT